MKKLFLTLIFFLACSTAHALTTLYGCTESGTVTWNSTTGAYWVSTTGAQAACTGGIVAGTGNDLVLNAASTGNWTLNASFSEDSLTTTGMTGTFTMGTSHTLTLATLSTLSGAFSGTTSTITITGGGLTLSGNVTGSGVTISLTTATQTIDSSASLYTNALPLSLGYAGTIQLAAGHSWTNSGLVTFAAATNLNYNSVGGSSADTFTTSGGLTMTSSSGATPTATIILTGGILNGNNGNGVLYNNLTINPSSSIVTFSTALNYRTGTLAYIPSTYSVAFSSASLQLRACTLNTDGISWPSISWQLSGTLTLLSNLEVSGAFISPTSLTFSGPYNITVGSISATLGTTTTLILVAKQTLTITSSFYLTGNSTYPLTIQSATASSPTYINYTGSIPSENLSGVIFTDVYATGPTVKGFGPVLFNYNGGTLTRTQGIVNVTAANIQHRQPNYSNGV